MAYDCTLRAVDNCKIYVITYDNLVSILQNDKDTLITVLKLGRKALEYNN